LFFPYPADLEPVAFGSGLSPNSNPGEVRDCVGGLDLEDRDYPGADDRFADDLIALEYGHHAIYLNVDEFNRGLQGVEGAGAAGDDVRVYSGSPSSLGSEVNGFHFLKTVGAVDAEGEVDAALVAANGIIASGAPELAVTQALEKLGLAAVRVDVDNSAGIGHPAELPLLIPDLLIGFDGGEFPLDAVCVLFDPNFMRCAHFSPPSAGYRAA
jgi:hypothetical protein